MNRTTRLWINYVVIFMLVFAIIPVSGLISAAGSPIVIADPLGTIDAPTPITTQRINILGSFYSVTDLKYTVTQLRKLSTGELVAIQSREGVEKAYISGSNFTFYNVELFEGLNEITVTGRDANGTSTPSERVYVEYSKLPIILSVKYGEQDLKANNVISDKLFNDELLIKGAVNNAESIVAKINGKATEYIGSVLSNGTYIIAKIPLQRGKNTLEVIASNNTKEYPVKLDIIYNDGNPYIGNANILDTTATPIPLESSMNITTSDATVDGQLNNFSITDELQFTFNTTKFSVLFNDFDTAPIGGVVAEVVGSYQLTKTGADTFRVYFPNAIQNSLNILQFTFTRGLEKFTQIFNLEHFDPLSNYITHVSGLSDSTTNKLLTFYIFTKDPTIYEVQQVRPDSSISVLTPVSSTPQATETMHKFEVLLEPGYNDFVARPNNNDVNMKQYRVLYINSPDVKIVNLVNGDRVGGVGQETEIIGQLVNVDLDDRDKTKISIDNRSGLSSYLLTLANFAPSPDDYQFSFDLLNKLTTGANEITIEVTDGSTITKTRITLFYFSDNGPDATLYVDETRKIQSSDTFNETAVPGTIETEARYAHFKGSYSNTKDIIFYLNGVRVIQEVVQPIGTGVKSTVGIDPVSGETVRLKIDWDNQIFYTDYPIYLHEGNNVFEVEVISSTGTSLSEKLYINRVKPPVKLIAPDLSKETVVNSNFIEVSIEVAVADRVVINKVEATYEKLSDQELRNLINALGPEVLAKYDTDGSGFLDDNEVAKVDQSEVTGKRYVADVFLKPGANKIKYEIYIEGNKTTFEFEIYYADSPKEGARFKTEFADKMDAFDKKIQIKFPKNTLLAEPNQSTALIDEFKSNGFIEFGIVDRQTGKLIKVWDEALDKFVLEEFNEPYKTLMPVRVIPPDRTGYAGQVYWIEADGTLKDVDSGYVPTNRGTITLAYDNSIVNDAQNQLAIYHFDRKREQWVNLGGIVDTKKKTVTTTIEEFGYYTVMAKRGTYNDIIGHSWAASYLHTMYSKGIMMPESYNRFGADLLTTRGEFATILVKALDIPINAGPYINGNKLYPVNPTFVDVIPLLDPPNGFYSYEYLETAARAGIVRGMGQGEFGPDGLLTREQAATMVARAANYKLTTDLDKAKVALRKEYADVDKINNYSMPYVLAVTKAGIMTGSISNNQVLFNPSSYLSRAEASVIAYRLMVELKKLPK